MGVKERSSSDVAGTGVGGISVGGTAVAVFVGGGNVAVGVFVGGTAVFVAVGGGAVVGGGDVVGSRRESMLVDVGVGMLAIASMVGLVNILSSRSR